MKLYKIQKSKIDNLGLYAAKNIKKGTRVIEYKGRVITRREAEENPKYDNGKAIYLFNLNKKYDLDGDFKFNTARLINHSCDPNCEVVVQKIVVVILLEKDPDGELKKKRKKGEKITFYMPQKPIFRKIFR